MRERKQRKNDRDFGAGPVEGVIHDDPTTAGTDTIPPADFARSGGDTLSVEEVRDFRVGRIVRPSDPIAAHRQAELARLACEHPTATHISVRIDSALPEDSATITISDPSAACVLWQSSKIRDFAELLAAFDVAVAACPPGIRITVDDHGNGTALIQLRRDAVPGILGYG